MFFLLLRVSSTFSSRSQAHCSHTSAACAELVNRAYGVESTSAVRRFESIKYSVRIVIQSIVRARSPLA
eukprot:3426324-Pleurochrysis_carterae.AAC.1